MVRMLSIIIALVLALHPAALAAGYTPAGGGSSFGGDGTSSRALPTSGAASGEFWLTTPYATTNTCTWTDVKIYSTSTVAIAHTITVAASVPGAAEKATSNSSNRGAGLAGGSSGLSTTTCGGGGGGHGGSGGNGGSTIASQSGLGGPACTQSLCGSGGGGGASSSGAAGGNGSGGLYIESLGQITLTANINANGADGGDTAVNSAGAGGAGSAGDCDFRSRTGVDYRNVTISAAGGAGGDSTHGTPGGGGGGGGGGVIRIYSPNNQNSGATLTVTGGGAGAGSATGPATAGGNGTTDVQTVTPGPRLVAIKRVRQSRDTVIAVIDKREPYEHAA